MPCHQRTESFLLIHQYFDVLLLMPFVIFLIEIIGDRVFRNVWKILVVGVVLSVFTGCGDNEGGGDDGEVKAGDYYLTYNLSDSCSTGRQVLHARSETDMANLFCDSMKDNVKNRSCAEYQRKKLFEMHCQDMSWPHKSTPKSGSMIHMEYSFVRKNCGTGWHIFSGVSGEEVMRDYCLKILDDDFNRNCARAERYDHYMKVDCDKFIKQTVNRL